MMKFLQIALCAAAVGFASAQLTLPVPARAIQPLAAAYAAARGVELEQLTFQPVRPSNIQRVEISRNTPGLSDVCYDSLLVLQNDAPIGEGLDVILGEVASRCTRIVTREALEANQGPIITTIACPINDFLESLALSCGELGGTIADFTVTQDITRTDRENFFVRLSQDYYQCIPFNSQGCSASDVEAIGVALAAGLAAPFFQAELDFINDIDNNLAGAEPVVDVQFSVTGLVFDDNMVPQGIFGGADAFLTTTTITGATRSQPGQAPQALFIRSDDLAFPDVTVLSTLTNPTAPETCKNAASSLNTNSLFRSSRCVADCQERDLPDAVLNVWCPRPGAILIREGIPPLPPQGVAMPITSFQAMDTGFNFTGTPSSAPVQIPPVRTNAPAQNQQPATLPGGNPILAPGVGLPIATLPSQAEGESDGSSSLAPTAVTTAVCLVFAVVSRRFC